MSSRRTSKCRCCGELFKPDVRNRGRQKYCSKPACRRAGKAAQQRRWREKPENHDYFRGAWNVERVRAWRAAHPGYWRAHRRGRAAALQDALAPEVIESAEDFATRALQDALRLQGPVLIGLIAHLSDSALQDDIATTTRGLLQLGRCDAQALALYLFLLTVGDDKGLSYYADATLSRRLSMDEPRLHQARCCLISAGLIAYEAPLYQVLSLDPPAASRAGGLQALDVQLTALQARLGRRGPSGAGA